MKLRKIWIDQYNLSHGTYIEGRAEPSTRFDSPVYVLTEEELKVFAVACANAAMEMRLAIITDYFTSWLNTQITEQKVDWADRGWLKELEK